MSVGTTIYLAGAEVERLVESLLNNGVKNVLLSYFYIHRMRKENYFDRMMAKHPEVNWFLDSGAFTFYAQAKAGTIPTAAINQYVRRYFNYVDVYGDRYCRVTEPDLDVAGYDYGQVRYWLMEMLDRWPELNITPTWHANREQDAWLSYLEDPNIRTLAIGSGDIKNVGQIRRMVMLAAQYGKPVHGFGCTRINTILKQVPFDSVDSVAGSSTVWVRSNGKSALALPISQLYADWSRGQYRGWETLTAVGGPVGYAMQWARLHDVVRHRVEKPLIEVTVTGGRRLRLTEDHGLFRRAASGSLEETPTSDIRVGDTVAAARDAIRSPDVVYLGVISIRLIQSKVRNVYDLSVPGTEKFIANGLLVHNSSSWNLGQKIGATFIFRNNRFQRIDDKTQRKKFKSYFRNIGCDPAKVVGDDLYEVRKANILAWRALSDRMEYQKMHGRQTHGVDYVTRTVDSGREAYPGLPEMPVAAPKPRGILGELFIPKERDTDDRGSE